MIFLFEVLYFGGLIPFRMNTSTQEPAGSEYVRAFIAIDTTDEVKQKLGRVQEELQRLDAGVKWVAPENMHFTLVFLGDIPSGKAAPVAQAMDRVGAVSCGFSYEVAGLGFFGSRSSPRVIWAGIRADPALPAIQTSLCAELRKLDITLEDRPFKPHLTLGRVRSVRNTDAFLRKIQSHVDTSFGEVRADPMLLIRSVLTPRGPEYSILHRACLGARGEP